MVVRIGLEAREYKLLLKPKAFQHSEAVNVAEAFWDEHIASIVKDQLGAKASTGGFTERKQRTLRYFDTKRGLLVGRDFTLRERVETDAKGRDKRKITLKLRSPDLVIASKAELPPKSIDAKGVEKKFEEDIAPLQVATIRRGKTKVALAEPRSMRSRFARSTTQTVQTADSCANLGKAFELFPTLEAHLGAAGASIPKPGTALTAWWPIDETIYRGMLVELEGGLQAEFTVTLWRFPAQAPRRRVAELSYTYEPEGKAEPAAARAALKLFLALQDGLHDLMDQSSTTKTALALGPRGKVGPGMQQD